MLSQNGAPAACKPTGAVVSQPINKESSHTDNSISNALLAGYPDVLDTKDVGKALGVPVVTIRQMFREEQLPYFKVGAQYRVPKIWLLDFINNGGK
ncbi:MAG: helix-turn-helix domain-containing protein [Coriobacteriia bacterium]|nr:helix-turn-helix domain-containing protein [Coriobacteriia bacterium]